MTQFIFYEDRKTIRSTECDKCGSKYKEKYLETDYGNNVDYYTTCPTCTSNKKKEIQKSILSRHLAIVQKLKTESPRMLNIGVPKDYANKTIHDFSVEWLNGYNRDRAELALLKVSDYIEEYYHEHKNLILYGNMGTGKTLVSCIIANTLKNTSYYTSTSQIYMDILQSYDNHKQKDVLDAYTLCDLLIIDEVGNRSRSLKPHERDMIFYIMNKRYETSKPIVIITNSNSENNVAANIVKEFGYRIHDRICQRYIMIEFNWPSYRKKDQSKLRL